MLALWCNQDGVSMTVDYERIYAMEVELSFREQPTTLDGIMERLREIAASCLDEPLSEEVIAEWNVLVARREELLRGTDLRSRDAVLKAMNEAEGHE